MAIFIYFPSTYQMPKVSKMPKIMVMGYRLWGVQIIQVIIAIQIVEVVKIVKIVEIVNSAHKS